MNGQRDSLKTVHLYQIKIANIVYSDYEVLKAEKIITDSLIKNLHNSMAIRDSITNTLHVQLKVSEKQAREAIAETNDLLEECSYKDKKIEKSKVIYKIGGSTIILLIILLLL